MSMSSHLQELHNKHQVVVWAEAFGDSNESSHLPEILEGVDKN